MHKSALVLLILLFSLLLASCSREAPIEEKKAKPAAHKSTQASNQEKRDADKLDINSASEQELTALQGDRGSASKIDHPRPSVGREKRTRRHRHIAANDLDRIKEEIIARQK